jgi:hypothetical protein
MFNVGQLLMAVLMIAGCERYTQRLVPMQLLYVHGVYCAVEIYLNGSSTQQNCQLLSI